MKNIISVLLSLVFLISLTACGTNGTQDTEADTSSLSSNALDNTEVQTNMTTDGKTLVVYYSATGNTKQVAQIIAKTLNADLFEIVPKSPYTSDDLNWTDENSRVSIEHSDESKRNVPLQKSVPDNWEQYDTVYIGYPIWWGIAAWPVNSFVEDNDFSNKTVIPFCTSSSSDLGNSDELLEDEAGEGNWLEGKRFSSGASESEISDWARESAD